MQVKSRRRRIITWTLGVVGCTLWVLGMPFLWGDRFAIPAVVVIFVWVGALMYWRNQDRRHGQPPRN